MYSVVGRDVVQSARYVVLWGVTLCSLLDMYSVVGVTLCSLLDMYSVVGCDVVQSARYVQCCGV